MDGNSSGALCGGGKWSIGRWALEPKVARRSTRAKGGAADRNSRSMPPTNARIPDQPTIKSQANKIFINKRLSILAKPREKRVQNWEAYKHGFEMQKWHQKMEDSFSYTYIGLRFCQIMPNLLKETQHAGSVLEISLQKLLIGWKLWVSFWHRIFYNKST